MEPRDGKSPSGKDQSETSPNVLASPAKEVPAEVQGDAPRENELEGRDPAASKDDDKTEGSESQDEGEVDSSDSGSEEGDAKKVDKADKEVDEALPPLPDEPVPAGPEVDDGWDFQWDANVGAYYFYNRFTGKTQWENPRVPASGTAGAAPGVGGTAAAAGGTASTSPAGPPLPQERPVAGGYNPAIHGDYDPEAWYAKGYMDDGEANDEEATTAYDLTGAFESVAAGDQATATFNRFTGAFQRPDHPGRSAADDTARARRQLNAFFDVDAAANRHDGRSLRAERAGKKPTKAELKQFKEKRRAKKEEKRRAWLRD